MNVNIFKNRYDLEPYTTPLEKVIEMIRTSPVLEEYTIEARPFLASKQFESYLEIKSVRLPVFAPAGILNGGKKKKCLIGLTGICLLEINHLWPRLYDSVFFKLKNSPHVLMAYRSVSGNGVHVLIPYTIDDNEPKESLMNTPKAILDTYELVYGDISNYFKTLLGVEMLRENCHAHSLCTISYDAAAHVNYNAVPVTIRYEYFDAS